MGHTDKYFNKQQKRHTQSARVLFLFFCLFLLIFFSVLIFVVPLVLFSIRLSSPPSSAYFLCAVCVRAYHRTKNEKLNALQNTKLYIGCPKRINLQQSHTLARDNLVF